MKVNYEGCAICDSTWGNLWENVEGQRFFFCCDLCVLQFRSLVDRIKKEAGWDRIDSLDIAGDRRGRSCRAVSSGESANFAFAFNSEGGLRRFERVSSVPIAP